ncbi:hypothetical protein KL933_002370 [Ogataea haglerorum]|uniref:Aminotransferase class I/classII large domain-containing protein n=1 Tax=Ogataea haglerorum TaxID=1937702 RepID=A0AAN6D5D0_9ASCO|nr:hypothetical protein KL933_002370 [Ogataea haglerorum]
MSYQHENLMSERAKARVTRHFWSSAKLPEGEEPHPAPISLVGGMPNHDFFPVKSIRIGIAEKPFEDGYHEETAVAHEPQPDSSFLVSQVASDPSEIDLKTGLQYGFTNGTKCLVDFTRDFVKKVWRPGYDEWSTMLTCGGSNGIDKVFDSFLSKGDSMLLEEFTFIPILNSLNNLGVHTVPVKLDFGPDKTFDFSANLKEVLENWDTLHPGKKKPKLLYTIPTGQNPLGVAQTTEHKKKILQLAEEHDFVILEDEPYAYLNFQKVSETPRFDLTPEEFVDSLHGSYINLDTTGRVIRTETFSKVFAPGLRLGFLAGHKRVIQSCTQYSDLSSRAPSGISQILVNDTIRHMGGLDGWLKWIIKVRNEYLVRKNAFVKALLDTEAAKKGYLKVMDPECGMFVSSIIDFGKENLEKGTELLKARCAVNGVGVVYGGAMAVNYEFSKDRTNFVRMAICYTGSTDLLVEAAARLSKSVLEVAAQLE